MEALGNSRVALVQRVVQDVFSDELGTGRHFSFRPSHQEFQDLLNLIVMLLRVVLHLHESPYEGEHAGEVGLWFSLQNFKYEKFFKCLGIIVFRLRPDVIG